MTLSARSIALQGLHALSAIGIAVQGLLGGSDTPPPSAPSVGGAKTKPWHWVPFTHVLTRRPRKRRHADILFLGQ